MAIVTRKEKKRKTAVNFDISKERHKNGFTRGF